jgi:hypothetical protein
MSKVYRQEEPSVCDSPPIDLIKYRLKWTEQQAEYHDDQWRAFLSKAEHHRVKADGLRAERSTWVEALKLLGGTPPEEPETPPLAPTHCHPEGDNHRPPVFRYGDQGPGG